MRILVVTNAYPSPERPSYGIYVARLVAALERAGHEVVLAAASEQGGGWRTLRKYARLARRARAAARSGRPDVVWGHYLVPTGPIARRAAQGGARALCADRARHRRRERRALAAHPRGHGEGRRRRLRGLRRLGGSGRPPRRGRGPARRAPAHRQRGRRHRRLRRRRRGGRGRRARLGQRRPARRRASRNFIPRKNLARLLEAFALARAAWGGGSLALVGDGPLQRGARGARARARHRRERALRRSTRTPVEVPRWLRACDVACLVSEVEGFGLAPIEALACGRPVVVSRECALRGAP